MLGGTTGTGYHSDSDSDIEPPFRGFVRNMAEATGTEIMLARDMVPEYYGGSKDLLDFINKGEQFIELLKKPDLNCVFNKLLLHNIVSKIKGEARDLINNTSYSTWRDLKDILVARFGDKRNESSLAQELARMYQNPKESYQNYFDRINAQLQKVLQHVKLHDDPQEFIIKSKMYSEQALNRFINGLNDQYRSIFETCETKFFSNPITQQNISPRPNFRPAQQRPTSLPTPMSVDRSSVRTNTQPRPNYFQGNGKPSFIVEELHNQDEPFVGDDSHETDYEH
nr:unnamed protein product [Callosobruchus chinensis]